MLRQGLGNDGSFMAFGRLLLGNGCVMLEGLLCDRNFSPIATNLGALGLPHLTLAKNNYDMLQVERGCKQVWRLDESRSVDVTDVVRALDHEIHADGIPYRLRPASFTDHWNLRLCHLVGGEALEVFLHVQASLQDRLELLWDGVYYPEPHITYEYE